MPAHPPAAYRQQFDIPGELPPLVAWPCSRSDDRLRIYEEELHAAIEARSESLQTLRELGPPDLVHIIKQPIKSATKQVGVYHHVSGIDASSSASLAAYINTLTHSVHDKQHKVVSGLYWYADVHTDDGERLTVGQLLQCLLAP